MSCTLLPLIPSKYCLVLFAHANQKPNAPNKYNKIYISL